MNDSPSRTLRWSIASASYAVRNAPQVVPPAGPGRRSSCGTRSSNKGNGATRVGGRSANWLVGQAKRSDLGVESYTNNG